MAKKSGGAALRRLFDNVDSPLYVVDAKRRFAYCNRALSDWAGFAFNELADLRCDYHSLPDESPVRVAAQRLCPPPKVFEGEPQTAEVDSPHPDQPRPPLWFRYLPLPDNDSGEPAGVLAWQYEADEPQRLASPEASRLHLTVGRLRREMSEAYRMDRLLGRSPAIQHVRRQMEMAVGVQANVVVAGPPGSGREHVARAIHYGGPKSEDRRLAPLSCEILDRELLEVTLSSLADAESPTRNTTLLLLETDRLSEACQELLQHWLQDRDSAPRTIACCRQPLLAAADQGRFLHPLAFQLSTLQIELPPLSKRVEDIPLIAQAFLEESNRMGGEQRGGFSEEALDRLVEHDYSENLDELRRIVLHAGAHASGATVTMADLPDVIRWSIDAAAHPRREPEAIQLDSLLAEIERELIARALAAAKGNRTQAAELLGISRNKLLRRIAD